MLGLAADHEAALRALRRCWSRPAHVDSMHPWVAMFAARSSSGGEMPFGRRRLIRALQGLVVLGLVEQRGRQLDFELTSRGRELVDEIERRLHADD